MSSCFKTGSLEDAAPGLPLPKAQSALPHLNPAGYASLASKMRLDCMVLEGEGLRLCLVSRCSALGDAGLPCPCKRRLSRVKY